jgi:ElaB/YqjD/DUF883 family membrane-anchored ribosome-binding protein
MALQVDRSTGAEAMSTQYPPVKGKVHDKAEGLVDRAAKAARGVADQASDLTDRAVEHGREVGEMAHNAPGAMRDALDTSLKQQPMATLAVTGALGFVLGALWKS